MARGKSQVGSGWLKSPGKISDRPRRDFSKCRFLAEIADRLNFLDPAVLGGAAGS
jgi:hypothetical protein